MELLSQLDGFDPIGKVGAPVGLRPTAAFQKNALQTSIRFRTDH